MIFYRKYKKDIFFCHDFPKKVKCFKKVMVRSLGGTFVKISHPHRLEGLQKARKAAKCKYGK